MQVVIGTQTFPPPPPKHTFTMFDLTAEQFAVLTALVGRVVIEGCDMNSLYCSMMDALESTGPSPRAHLPAALTITATLR